MKEATFISMVQMGILSYNSNEQLHYAGLWVQTSEEVPEEAPLRAQESKLDTPNLS